MVGMNLPTGCGTFTGRYMTSGAEKAKKWFSFWIRDLNKKLSTTALAGQAISLPTLYFFDARGSQVCFGIRGTAL